MRRSRPTLLGRFRLDAQLTEEIARSGLLELRFVSAPTDTSLPSVDGCRSIAFLLPSGAIGGLLVQDYDIAEDRTIPFAPFEVEIVAHEDELVVRLWAPTEPRP